MFTPIATVANHGDGQHTYSNIATQIGKECNTQETEQGDAAGQAIAAVSGARLVRHDDGTDLTITWQANYDGVGVDPCNATAGPGVPVFFADGNGNLSILRNYAQGEDFILGTNPDGAGQPGSSVDVDDTNTTCAGNVATTVVPVEETDAMYGRVAIQGKPRIPNVDPDPDPDFADEYGTLMPVRAVTPTYDWVVGEGGAAPVARRAVADTSL